MRETEEAMNRDKEQWRLKQLRDEHFMRTCRRLLAASGGELTSARALAARAAMEPAPLYYVTFDYAHRVMRRYKHTGCLPRKGDSGVVMWREIIRRVSQMESRYGISDTEALSRVLQQPASSFFISPSTAVRLFHRIRHRRRRG